MIRKFDPATMKKAEDALLEALKERIDELEIQLLRQRKQDIVFQKDVLDNLKPGAQVTKWVFELERWPDGLLKSVTAIAAY